MRLFHHTQMIPANFTHAHENLEVTFCVHGSYLFHYQIPGGMGKEAQEAEVRISSGMLILMPAGIAHGNRRVTYPYDRYFFELTEKELLAVQGDRHLFSAILSQQEGIQPLFWDLSEHAEVFTRLLEHLYALYMDDSQSAPWKQVHLMHLLGLFFCEIHRHYANYFEASSTAYTRAVLQIKAYIDAHYALPITVEEMAKAHYISANYLSRCFYRQLGVSPRQYLTQKRLSMAHMELCSTTLSIQRIAERNGFCDVNYFIQLFKRSYGMTPKQFQKRILASHHLA